VIQNTEKCLDPYTTTFTADRTLDYAGLDTSNMLIIAGEEISVLGEILTCSVTSSYFQCGDPNSYSGSEISLR